MPGSGKTSVGKVLAQLLGWPLLDTDACLERLHGSPLQALIERLGESSFRKLEEEAVLGLEMGEPTVIATGGSVVYSSAAMARLAAASTVVFLDVGIDAIRERIAAQAPRGIVGMAEGGLEDLYSERQPLYLRYADLVLHLNGENQEQVARRLIATLSLAGPD